MQKRILIAYKLADGNGIINIPVVYEVEEDTALCLKIIRCRVDLPESALPAWLYPITFEISTHNRYGFHVTSYNDKDVRTLDAEFFRYKAYADIVLQERLHSNTC